MSSAFDLVSFLLRSENRVTALVTLASETKTRPELQDETGVPRATLSRILADFRDRDLVTRRGHEYAVTPLGGRVAAELESLFESVESMQALQTVAAWLPLDELGVDPGDLDGVRVTLPTPTDPMAPVKRAATTIENVEHVRGFCYSVVHAPILAECRNVLERGHRFEGVIAKGVLDVVSSDPELSGRMRDLLADGSAEVYVHEGDIEPQLIIAGETTMFLVTGDGGAIQGLVEIGDESILPWAEATFESIRREAEPLAPAAAAELLTA